MTTRALVQTALEAGRYDEAMQLLHAAINTSPTVELYILRAHIYTLLSHRKAALADLRTASAFDPAGEVGDQARRALLILLTPPQSTQPRSVRPAEPPHPWIVYVVILLAIISFACGLIFILTSGQAIVAPFLTPTPTALP